MSQDKNHIVKHSKSQVSVNLKTQIDLIDIIHNDEFKKTGRKLRMISIIDMISNVFLLINASYVRADNTTGKPCHAV